MEGKLNYNAVFEEMVENGLKYLRSNNLKAMVLGLSGGIDSTVSAFICHEIAKRSNNEIKFIGVSLPSMTNALAENSIANRLGKLCNKYVEHSIETDYRNIKTSFESDTDKMNPIQAGNIKARLRMMYLYNLASIEGGVVIDTDNVTEWLSGFWTLHGDSSDLNFGIGNLWKHEIYELAYTILGLYESRVDSTITDALKESIKIMPTDGNGTSNGDMEQLAPGLTYNELDEILEVIYCYCELFDKPNCEAFKKDMDELKKKYSAEIVDGVYRRYNNTKFKRKKLPIIL